MLLFQSWSDPIVLKKIIFSIQNAILNTKLVGKPTTFNSIIFLMLSDCF